MDTKPDEKMPYLVKLMQGRRAWQVESDTKWRNYEEEFISWLDSEIERVEEQVVILKRIRDEVESVRDKEDWEYIYKQNISWD